jgi:hypothetical protein
MEVGARYGGKVARWTTKHFAIRGMSGISGQGGLHPTRQHEPAVLHRIVSRRVRAAPLANQAIDAGDIPVGSDYICYLSSDARHGRMASCANSTPDCTVASKS